jgi:hypothetical protein
MRGWLLRHYPVSLGAARGHAVINGSGQEETIAGRPTHDHGTNSPQLRTHTTHYSPVIAPLSFNWSPCRLGPERFFFLWRLMLYCERRTRPRTARAITRLVINLKTAKVLASTFLWPTCRGSMRNITGSSTRRFAHGSAAAADIVAHGGVTAVIPITSQRCIGNTKQRVLV